MKRYAVEWIIFALGVIALGGVMIGLPEMDKVWLWVLWGALTLWVAAYVYVLRFCTTGFRALSIVVYVPVSGCSSWAPCRRMRRRACPICCWRAC